MFTQILDPTGNLFVTWIVAMIPVVLLLVLLAVFRVSARLGWNEQIGNHNSVILPQRSAGDPPLFLINPRGSLFQELTASSLIVCDLDGRVLRGKGELRKVAFHIHARLHLKKPNATCIVHVHPQYLTALSMLEDQVSALFIGAATGMLWQLRDTTAARRWPLQIAPAADHSWRS